MNWKWIFDYSIAFTSDSFYLGMATISFNLLSRVLCVTVAWGLFFTCISLKRSSVPPMLFPSTSVSQNGVVSTPWGGGGGVKCLFSPVWVKQMARWLGGWASLKREVSLEKKDQQYLYVYTFIRPLGIDSKKDLCRFINVLFVCSRPWLQYLFHRK